MLQIHATDLRPRQFAHAPTAQGSAARSSNVWRHQEEYFNAETYLSFVDGVLLPHYHRRRHRVYLIQDNASFHKKPGVLEFFAKHSRQIEVFSLPPYSPDFNAMERLWHYTRKESTHNRYFDRPAALCQSLPNSPPPRTWATASTPPRSTQASRRAANRGSIEMP